jgi:hypothetical protein
MCWFSSSGDDDAWTECWLMFGTFHGGRKMHCQCDRANDSIREMDKPQQVAQSRLTNQILHVLEWRMPMSGFTALDEVKIASKIIHHFLIGGWIPPLRGEVILPASNDDPVGSRQVKTLLEILPLFFLLREVQIPSKGRQRNGDSQPLFQELDVSVEKMIRSLIAFVDEWIVHVNALDSSILFPKRCDKGIASPQRFCGGTNICLKATRMGLVEISHSRRQHDNITRTLERSKNQPMHDTCHFK